MHNIHSTTDGYPALSTAVAKKNRKLMKRETTNGKSFALEWTCATLWTKNFV